MKIRDAMAGALAAFVLAALAACGSDDHSIPIEQVNPAAQDLTAVQEQPVEPVISTGATVTYQVSGTGKANITYLSDGNFSIEQAGGETLPWSKDVTFPDGLSLTGVNMNAQLDNIDFEPDANGNYDEPTSGSVTCSISVNGQVVDQHTSTGVSAIVTCSYDGD